MLLAQCASTLVISLSTTRDCQIIFSKYLDPFFLTESNSAWYFNKCITFFVFAYFAQAAIESNSQCSPYTHTQNTRVNHFYPIKSISELRHGTSQLIISTIHLLILPLSANPLIDKVPVHEHQHEYNHFWSLRRADFSVLFSIHRIFIMLLLFFCFGIKKKLPLLTVRITYVRHIKNYRYDNPIYTLRREHNNNPTNRPKHSNSAPRRWLS